jgi:ribonuclease VapC
MSASSQTFVLDSFATLAYLNGESGMERVHAVLQDAALGKCRVTMSLINLGEVIYITERECGLPQAQAALAAMDQLPIEILPATREAVLAAAHIKANFRVSYADAFAISLAQETSGTVLTGDPEFKDIKELVNVEWLA